MAIVYRVKQRSYINGQIVDAGALVVLPDGVEAGSNLEATEEDAGTPGVLLPPPGVNPAASVHNKPADDPLVESAAEPFAVTALLDGTVAEIRVKLADLSVQELEALKAAEEAGKTRKGLIDAITAEVQSRTGGEF